MFRRRRTPEGIKSPLSEETIRNIRLCTIVFLSAVIITAGIAVWLAAPAGEEITLHHDEQTSWNATLYIGGEVALPGYYPCRRTDTIQSLVEAAGGYSVNTSVTNPVLTLTLPGSEEQPQKIDINRAPSWLLRTLPGIGEVIAERIIDFRTGHGFFRTILELKQVEGIGDESFERIRPYITVND